jgi:hypothetical protein
MRSPMIRRSHNGRVFPIPHDIFKLHHEMKHLAWRIDSKLNAKVMSLLGEYMKSVHSTTTHISIFSTHIKVSNQ